LDLELEDGEVVAVVAGGGGDDMGGGTEGGLPPSLRFSPRFSAPVFSGLFLSRSPSSRWVFLLSLSFFDVEMGD
jgi:hypothetical protein